MNSPEVLSHSGAVILSRESPADKMPTLIEELSSLHLFAVLSDDQLHKLVADSQTILLKKNETLFRIGDLSNQFFYLKSGQIKISRSSPQGIEKVLHIVSPGQLFAEAVMFMEDGRFPATAVALKTSKVVGIENHTFIGYLRESQDLSMAMMRTLSNRLHQLVVEIDQLTLQNATYRLLRFINTLIPADSANAVEVELPAAKHTIASHLSITPETFSRSLNSLNEQNVIRNKGKSRRIEIMDVARFKDFLTTG